MVNQINVITGLIIFVFIRSIPYISDLFLKAHSVHNSNSKKKITKKKLVRLLKVAVFVFMDNSWHSPFSGNLAKSKHKKEQKQILSLNQNAFYIICSDNFLHVI